MTEIEAKIAAILLAVKDYQPGPIVIPCSTDTLNYYVLDRLDSALFKRTWREERRHYTGMTKGQYLLCVWWPKRGITVMKGAT